MGWTGERASRDEVVKRHAGPWKSIEGPTVTAVKQHRVGEEDWFLFEAKNADGSVRERWIQVMVWDGGLHKEIDEACGPYFYGCPLAWLDEAPQPKQFSAFNWREAIRQKQAA